MITILNNEIINTWNNFRSNFNNKQNKSPFSTFRSPVFISNHISPNKCKLLVIGLNPSYSEDGWRGVFKNAQTGQKVNSLQLPESRNLVNAAITNASNFEQLPFPPASL